MLRRHNIDPGKKKITLLVLLSKIFIFTNHIHISWLIKKINKNLSCNVREAYLKFIKRISHPPFKCNFQITRRIYVYSNHSSPLLLTYTYVRTINFTNSGKI